MNGQELKGCPIGVSEDFSKATQNEHKQLWNLVKEAKDSKYVDAEKAIVNIKITYKRVILTYTTNKTNPQAKTFFRSFSLKEINNNTYWYIPQPRK